MYVTEKVSVVCEYFGISISHKKLSFAAVTKPIRSRWLGTRFQIPELLVVFRWLHLEPAPCLMVIQEARIFPQAMDTKERG